jgi:SAM-dependent methyltransferase
MRNQINQFVKVCAEGIACPEPIYEFGSFQVPGQESISNLRPYFPGKKYVGTDFRQGAGVDVVLDLHHIDLPDASVGTVLLLETLEHVEYPHEAMKELFRVMKPDGVIIMSSAMNFIIHDYPNDYWRFTPEAFRSLLKAFRQSLVFAAGESLLPHTVVGIGFKGATDADLNALGGRMEEWRRYWTAASRPKGFKRFLKYISRQHDKIRKALGMPDRTVC